MAKGTKIAQTLKQALRKPKPVRGRHEGRTSGKGSNSNVTGSHVHDFGPDGPKNATELKTRMSQLVQLKSGKQLISTKFNKDHEFSGHGGQSLGTQADQLAHLRNRAADSRGRPRPPASTKMQSQMESNSKHEVKNWIDNVPDASLIHEGGGRWRIDNNGSTVPAANNYNWRTIGPDGATSSRGKNPALACAFGPDGTPVVYHLDY